MRQGRPLLNIKQVAYFISVAQTGSLSAAAREHGISVQAMSKAMSDLEKETIHPLFVRSHHGVALTPFGREFCGKAELVQHEFHDLENFIGSMREKESQIKAMLCAPVFLNNAKARAKIESFIHGYLNLDAEVSIGKEHEGLAQLREGTVDALITIGMFEREGLDCLRMGTVPTGICVAKNHPLASRDEVTIDEVARYPIIFSENFDHSDGSIMNTYRKERDDFNVVPLNFTRPFEACKIFYTEHSVSFMALVAALGEMMPFSVMIPIAEKDHRPIPICLVTLSDRKTTAYLKMEQMFTNEKIVASET